MSTDKKNVTVVVNGDPHEWPKTMISYDEVVALGYPGNLDCNYTIAYMKKNGGSSTSMSKGDSVKVKDGMIFNVTPTGQS